MFPEFSCPENRRVVGFFSVSLGGLSFPKEIRTLMVRVHRALAHLNSMKPCKKWDTPLKINMEHNHGGLQDHFPF